ncbi:MAG: class I SAM-dependent methyltransferase [Candidatus Helarchaeota archaeon]|nr:class I SAM-dependent methyltransferase [Candidatus Helarchaeota archaeon]
MAEHYYTDIPLSKIDIFTIKPFIRNRQYQFKTCSGVFCYKKLDKGTKLLLKNMQIPENASHVLDMGTGYGIIGIVVATEFPHINVKMIDINRRAVWIARENLKLNNISNAKIYWGDFYDPIKKEKGKFDVILINPPLALGHKKNFQFILNTPNFLKTNGYLYLVVRTRQGAKKISEKMNDTFGNVELLKIHGGYRLYRSQKKPNQKI